jgi:hypothetical protein
MYAAPPYPPPPPPPPPLPPPPPASPEEIARWRADTEATVARVREEAVSVAEANTRGAGWMWLAIAAFFGALELSSGLEGYFSGLDTTLLLEQLFLPVLFAAEGLLFVLFPRRFGALQQRNSRRIARFLDGLRPTRTPVASALVELRRIREEITRWDSSSAMEVFGAILVVIGGFVLAGFTVWSVERAVATGAPPWVPGLDLLIASGAAGAMAYLYWRVRRSAAEVHALAQRLGRFQARITELEWALWA